tara:strand:+ start:395 stop:670 length:276 start_codon:yes stop_codon:yes gene_type:complete
MIYMLTITLLAFVMAFITTHFYFKNRELIKQFDFLEDEIESTLEDENLNEDRYPLDENQRGWVEALQYSLRQVRFARMLTLKEVNNVDKKS